MIMNIYWINTGFYILMANPINVAYQDCIKCIQQNNAADILWYTDNAAL